VTFASVVVLCPALPCPALPCPALPCPALPCPALTCPALPCPALPCPALPIWQQQWQCSDAGSACFPHVTAPTGNSLSLRIDRWHHANYDAI